jgi:energy-coupling factor transporter ATP-binding protein EcfA2
MSNLSLVGHTDEVDQILGLVGERVRILHPGREQGGEGGGGDIDCAVEGLDPLWPLRLPQGWRVCQTLHYDVGGSWCWVLERDGRFLRVDVLDDPAGLGGLGYPTKLAINGSGSLEAPPAVRAAYLTTKRLDKRIVEPAEWRRIGDLARQDPDRYRAHLAVIFGTRWAASLASAALAGAVPDPSSRRKSMRSQSIRRLERNLGLIRLPIAWAARVLERLRYPTGLSVLVVGPDGAGKSTLVSSLSSSLESFFGRMTHLHWRPGILPPPGAVLGTPVGDPSQPHGRPPHGRALSIGLLLYHWLDFQIGEIVRVMPTRARSGLVLWERGWWDIAADPVRYRMRVPRGLVLSLGRALHRPDLVLVLEAPPDVLLTRKMELEQKEAARQTLAWRDVLPKRIPRVYLDGTGSPTDVRRRAQEAVLRFMGERTVSRLGPGWARGPAGRSVPWIVPRGPRSTVASSLRVRHPMALAEVAEFGLRRAVGVLGAMRLAPRSSGPPREVREALASHIEPGGSIAVTRSGHPGRYVAIVLGRDGRARFVAKVATDEEGSRALAREGSTLQRVVDSLPPPLVAPRVLAQEESLLIVNAVPWQLRVRPWVLPLEVAYALGSWFASTRRRTPDGVVGFSHGDCAPWNLLPVGDRWCLVDWEAANDQATPFVDLFDYVVQAHALFHRPSRKQLMEGLVGKGWVGAAAQAYADGSGMPTSGLEQFFMTYLRTALCTPDPGHDAGRTVRDAQQLIFARMDR